MRNLGTRSNPQVVLCFHFDTCDMFFTFLIKFYEMNGYLCDIQIRFTKFRLTLRIIISNDSRICLAIEEVSSYDRLMG